MPRLLLVAAALFLVAPAMAQQSNAPLSVEQQTALRASILSATQAADFKRSKQLLEVYRTLRAAGVALTSAEAFDMGECARMRGNPNEAVIAFGLLTKDDAEYRQNIVLIKHMQEQAAQDRATGIEEGFRIVQGRTDPWSFGVYGEVFAAVGLHARAIPIYERAFGFTVSDPTALKVNDPTKLSDADIARLASEAARLHSRDVSFYSVELQQRRAGLLGVAPKPFTSGEFTPADKALIQLNYGISLFRIGRIADARATWSAIGCSPTVENLAKAWIDIADISEN
jgi:tetratricopeptide (TPR) repeat protein